MGASKEAQKQKQVKKKTQKNTYQALTGRYLNQSTDARSLTMYLR